MSQASVQATALEGWGGYVGPTCLKDLETGRTAASTIPLADFVRFSEQVVETTRDVTIPWLAGINHEIAALGVIGDSIHRANRVGTAIRRLVDYFALLQDCTDIRFELEDGMASVNYQILDPDIWPRHYDAMFSLGIVAQLLTRGTKGAWERIEFSFEADRSEMRGDITKALCAPCTFGADTNQIRFPAAMLDLELNCQNPSSDIRHLNTELVRWRREKPLVERVESAIYRDLNSATIDQERVSRELGMSSRTMRRKLADEGSSFKDLLDSCRLKQALFEFRTRPDHSIAEIALRLGYSEHSNFTRAFHRWVGVAPQTFRNRLEPGAH